MRDIYSQISFRLNKIKWKIFPGIRHLALLLLNLSIDLCWGTFLRASQMYEIKMLELSVANWRLNKSYISTDRAPRSKKSRIRVAGEKTS